MRYCNNCGEKLEDDAKFCPSCGMKFTEQTQEKQATTTAPSPQQSTQEPMTPPQQPMTPPQQPSYQQYPANNPYGQINNNIYTNTNTTADKPSGKINVGMLVWSIINLLFCCMPFGLASLISTITANSSQTAQEEAKKLKTAKICNIIGTIAGVFIIIIYIIAVSAGVLGDLSSYT